MPVEYNAFVDTFKTLDDDTYVGLFREALDNGFFKTLTVEKDKYPPSWSKSLARIFFTPEKVRVTVTKQVDLLAFKDFFNDSRNTDAQKALPAVGGLVFGLDDSETIDVRKLFDFERYLTALIRSPNQINQIIVKDLLDQMKSLDFETTDVNEQTEHFLYAHIQDRVLVSMVNGQMLPGSLTPDACKRLYGELIKRKALDEFRVKQTNARANFDAHFAAILLQFNDATTKLGLLQTARDHADDIFNKSSLIDSSRADKKQALQRAEHEVLLAQQKLAQVELIYNKMLEARDAIDRKEADIGRLVDTIMTKPTWSIASDRTDIFFDPLNDPDCQALKSAILELESMPTQARALDPANRVVRMNMWLEKNGKLNFTDTLVLAGEDPPPAPKGIVVKGGEPTEFEGVRLKPGDTIHARMGGIHLVQDFHGRVYDHSAKTLSPEEQEIKALKYAKMAFSNYIPGLGPIVISGGDPADASRVYAALLALGCESAHIQLDTVGALKPTWLGGPDKFITTQLPSLAPALIEAQREDLIMATEQFKQKHGALYANDLPVGVKAPGVVVDDSDDSTYKP